MEFDFSTLNSSDLEVLVRDLWNAEENRLGSEITFKVFRDGRDRGIDLLYATNLDNHAIIGQVKHYYRSAFTSLYHHLKQEELPKVKKLKPGKYRLATSLDLSVTQTEVIYDLFRDYMSDISSIYSKKDLNRLLNDYPHQIGRHFKLWYSATPILQLVMDHAIIDRSKQYQETEIKRKIRLYVKTDFFDQAMASLIRNNVLIITGEPGIGKTTLAQLLTFELVRVGYEFVHIEDNIKDVEQRLRNDDSKQLFYFDDFLGHNSLEIARAKSSESAMIGIIARVRLAVNKKFILTTRSLILNAAMDESEKLRRANWKAIEGIVKQVHYEQGMRFQILRNHVEESELGDEYKSLLLSRDFELFLNVQTHFYPRSIEYITSEANVGHLSLGEFLKFIFEQFQSPDLIWQHAYERQISEIDRFFLNTLLTFDDPARIESQEKAFLSRLKYETDYNHFSMPMQAFIHAIKRLEGGFIKIADYMEDYETVPATYVGFINHSLKDFLLHFLVKDQNEVIRMAESVIYPTQLSTRLFPLDDKIYDLKIPDRLQKRFLNKEHGFVIPDDNERATLALVILKYYNNDLARSIACSHLQEIKAWQDIGRGYGVVEYLKVLIKDEEIPIVYETLKQIGYGPFELVLNWIYDLDEFNIFYECLTNRYGIDMMALLARGTYDWNQHVTWILDNMIAVSIEELSSHLFDEIKLDEVQRKVMQHKLEISRLGITPTPDFGKFNDYALNAANMNSDQ